MYSLPSAGPTSAAAAMNLPPPARRQSPVRRAGAHRRNVVERSIRPIALNRKNALFAGSDGGGEHWGVIASLIETCKLNNVDPQAYLTDVITRIVNNHPSSRIDELLPWAYPAVPPLKDVA